MVFSALVLAGFLTMAPDSVPATVRGVVADSAGHPVTTASVAVDGGEWRPVHEDGSFSLAGLTAGRHLLLVRSAGFALDSLHFKADWGETIAMSPTLQRVNKLAEVAVTATADTAKPLVTRIDWNEGFDKRRKTNIGGVYIDETEVRKRTAPQMTDLLRGVSGVTLIPIYDDMGTYTYRVVMRGTSTTGGKYCPIQYYVDGHPYDIDDINRFMSPRSVAAMEIYPGSSHVPEQFKGGGSARCGVIVIWTTSARSTG